MSTLKDLPGYRWWQVQFSISPISMSTIANHWDISLQWQGLFDSPVSETLAHNQFVPLPLVPHQCTMTRTFDRANSLAYFVSVKHKKENEMWISQSPLRTHPKWPMQLLPDSHLNVSCTSLTLEIMHLAYAFVWYIPDPKFIRLSHSLFSSPPPSPSCVISVQLGHSTSSLIWKLDLTQNHSRTSGISEKSCVVQVMSSRTLRSWSVHLV